MLARREDAEQNVLTVILGGARSGQVRKPVP